MDHFNSDGVQIAYHQSGPADGEPILLIHGFASNTRVNWVSTGWVKALEEAGFRVVSIDNRGHGESEKLYDLEAYPAPKMAEDAARLLAHLGIGRAHVMGYSMGARITAFLALKHPETIASVVFGGLGYNMVRGMAGTGPIAAALEAPSLDDVTNDTARTFRAFAEQTGSDLKALAACIRSSRDPITPEALSGLKAPALVVVGSRDVVGGSAEKLANLLPDGRPVTLEDRDHMKAVGDAVYKREVIAFLRQHPIEGG